MALDKRMAVNAAATQAKMPRSALLRYLGEKDLANWLGFDGKTLPVDCLPLLMGMEERRSDPRFKPKTLATTLREQGARVVSAIVLGLPLPADQAEPDSVGRTESRTEQEQTEPGTLTEQQQAAPDRLPAFDPREFAEMLGAAIGNALAGAQPKALPDPDRTPDRAQTDMREDRLIGAQEAADMLHCSVYAVGRRVKQIAPGAYSYIMIQDWIRERRESAKKNARETQEPLTENRTEQTD